MHTTPSIMIVSFIIITIVVLWSSLVEQYRRDFCDDGCSDYDDSDCGDNSYSHYNQAPLISPNESVILQISSVKHDTMFNIEAGYINGECTWLRDDDLMTIFTNQYMYSILRANLCGTTNCNCELTTTINDRKYSIEVILPIQ